MPIILNSDIIREKNALHGSSAFLVMLEITVPGLDDGLRVVLNTEDIRWKGRLWQEIGRAHV